MADYTWQGIPNEPKPTDPVGDRSCPGGVCGGGSGPGNVGYIGTPWIGEKNTGYGGQKTLGDYYREQSLQLRQLAEKKLAWQQILNQFSGPEDTWIRMLIRDRMEYLDMSDREYRQASRGVNMPAVPDWMQEYIVPEGTQPEMPGYSPVQPGGGRRRTWNEPEPSYTLRPLSAQEKLNPEQQSYLAGWMAWQRAGAPTEYSESGFAGMADIDRWWSPYIAKSQAMFPKTPNKPRWATAVQR